MLKKNESVKYLTKIKPNKEYKKNSIKKKLSTEDIVTLIR